MDSKHLQPSHLAVSTQAAHGPHQPRLLRSLVAAAACTAAAACASTATAVAGRAIHLILRHPVLLSLLPQLGALPLVPGPVGLLAPLGAVCNKHKSDAGGFGRRRALDARSHPASSRDERISGHRTGNTSVAIQQPPSRPRFYPINAYPARGGNQHRCSHVTTLHAEQYLARLPSSELGYM